MVTVPPSDTGGPRLLCKHRTNIHSQGGDSGSPIFYDGQSGTGLPGPEWAWVYPAGVLFGGPIDNFNITIFSPIGGMRTDYATAGHGPFDIQLWCGVGDPSPIYPCT